MNPTRWLTAAALGSSFVLVAVACPAGQPGAEPVPRGESAQVDPAVETPTSANAAVGDTATGRHWSFDGGTANGIPAGWSPGETNGAGTPATWGIVVREDAPSAPNTFGVTLSKNRGQTFNVGLAEDTRFQDLDLSVEVLAVSGEEDQGGGPLWRAADADNYYIARWNPLERNFRVYIVVDGRRRQLASAPATDDISTWHTIRVVAIGAHIDCYLDGEKLLSVDDETFASAGEVGLWTKADATVLFDSLRVEPAPP
jgi:hypothetical protein